MHVQDDPFIHHPELREQITDPLHSFFRTFTTADLAKLARERGLPFGWWYSEEERETKRARELAGYPPLRPATHQGGHTQTSPILQHDRAIQQ